MTRSKPNDADADAAFNDLLERFETFAVEDQRRIITIVFRLRDLQERNARLTAVVGFFRNALPWAMRKAAEVEVGTTPVWLED